MRTIDALNKSVALLERNMELDQRAAWRLHLSQKRARDVSTFGRLYRIEIEKGVFKYVWGWM